LGEKERFQERREALQEKVKAFQQQGTRFVPLDTTTALAPSQEPATASDSGESDEEGFFLDDCHRGRFFYSFSAIHSPTLNTLFIPLSTFFLQISQDNNKATTNSYDCLF
jgi:hypothetical protein